MLGGCSKDFLNQSPISNLAEDTYYQTESDFDRAVSGVYAKLLTFPDVNNLYLSECRSNNYYVARQDAARDYFNISSFEVTSQLGTLGTAWRNDYELIERANKVLSRIDNVPFLDDNKKARYKGEVSFLRALAYFELVKAFGPVPLIDKELIASSEAANYPRVGIDTVYNFIIKDLTYASTVLPPTYTAAADKGRATQYAALGLLGKAYMFTAGYPLLKTANYALALSTLQKVVAAENTGWKFATNYADLFKAANDNLYNIFEIQFMAGGQGQGNNVPGEVIPIDMDLKITPFGMYYMSGEPSADLINSYETGDKRKFLTLDTIYRTKGNVYARKNYFKKFLDSSSAAQIKNSTDWPINFPVMRGEEAMLLYAEAINEVNNGPTPEAVGFLNRTRARAGLLPVNPATKDDFALALEKERRSEFAWEGLYWWDLIRTGRALAVMNPWLLGNYAPKQIDKNQFVYPIPRSEMLVFPGLYYQNLDYN
jgi:hypothetical protein